MFGPRPPMEHMKAWLRESWALLGIEVELVQVLPNGYFNFLLEEASMALKVIWVNQWMYRSIPFSFFHWSYDFNLIRPRTSLYLVWVELPSLPQSLHKWVTKIVSPLGKVLGTRPKTNCIPSWYPHIVVEINIVKPLPKDVTIIRKFTTRVETVLYKHLPNACFQCGRQGHQIKGWPI